MPLSAGVSQTDITPSRPVWLAGYGDRDHRSEGVYQKLRAAAVYLRGARDETLLIAADLIGYDLAYTAQVKQRISIATGLVPRQIVLTATHTHCAPLYYPMMMHGNPDMGYAEWLCDRLVETVVSARAQAIPAHLDFSRTYSRFGVNRRVTKNGVTKMAPNPEGPMDHDLDTLWITDQTGKVIATLTVYGCHATSLAGYMIGGDYPGFLCRALEEETKAPALFSTGCAGDVRPWYNPGGDNFQRPQIAAVEAAGRRMAGEVIAARNTASRVDASRLAIAGDFHLLPYAGLPDADYLDSVVARERGHRRNWAEYMKGLLEQGPLPHACPHEIQVLQLNPDINIVFLGGEILSEIGLHLKQLLAPATTVTVAYSNGLVGYIPSKNAYPRGGYEVDGSYHYFLMAAPYSDKVEELILKEIDELVSSFDGM